MKQLPTPALEFTSYNIRIKLVVVVSNLLFVEIRQQRKSSPTGFGKRATTQEMNFKAFCCFLINNVFTVEITADFATKGLQRSALSSSRASAMGNVAK